MDDFAKIAIEEKEPYFEKAASIKGVTDLIIEKDLWVTWTLKRLFSIPGIKENLTFKGGTSLSKVYNLIERFSEDIDLSVEKKYLGFGDDSDPEKVEGSKNKKAVLQELADKCKEFVQTELLTKLTSSMKTELEGIKDTWKLEVDPDTADGQSLLFHYPTSGKIKKSKYVRKVVKIELGAKSDHWPVEDPEVMPILEEVINGTLDDPVVKIKVLKAERTFWEKATILHVFAHYPEGKSVQERQSRHYYDFFKLLKSDIKGRAEVDINLLDRVTTHKLFYFKAAWARYEDAKKGTLKLIPEKWVSDEMEKDYKAMEEMFYGEKVLWRDIVKEIEEFEKSFNC